MSSNTLENSEVADHVLPTAVGEGEAPTQVAGGLGRVVKFGLVGASGVVVNLVILQSLYSLLGVPYGLAAAAGIAVSIFTNFLLNDSWTWGDRLKGDARRDWFRRLVKYYVSASGAAVVNWSVNTGLKTYVLGTVSLELPAFVGAHAHSIDVAPTIAVICGVAVGMTINFAASHLWAFRDAEVEE